MAGPQKGGSVTIRRDLTEMLNEINFEDLNLTVTAGKIAPEVPVSKDSGRYPVMTRESKMKLFETRRHSDGSYPRAQWEWEDDNYVTYEYGMEEPVDNVSALRNIEFINEEEESAKIAYYSLMLGREYRVSSALYNTTTFTGSTNTTAITNEWDDATNATPWADIDGAAKQIRGKSGINKHFLSVVLSDDLVDYAIRTDEIKNFITYNNNADVLKGTLAEKARWLASYFGVKEIVIVSALYDTARLAASATIGKFWSNEYIFIGLFCPPSSSVKSIGVIKQLVWTPYSDSYVTESYPDDVHNSVVVRCREYRGIKVNTDYGHLLTNAKTTVNATTGI